VSPSPKAVYWNEDGRQVVFALEENMYLLNFNNDAVTTYVQDKNPSQADEDDEGLEEAFEF
jgi:hypothetical protein